MSHEYFLSKYADTDWCVFTGLRNSGVGTLEGNLVKSGSCRGIQKLVQRWLLYLLTTKGSMPFSPSRGCNFLMELRSCRTEEGVRVAYAFAMMDVEPQLRSDETEDMLLEELYQSAELLDVSLMGGVCTLHIRITSQAGTSREIVLPVYEA